MDFVDAGLPSTVCDESDYAPAIAHLLSRMAALDPDVIVLAWCGVPFDKYRAQVVYDNPAFADTRAVREQRVVSIPETCPAASRSIRRTSQFCRMSTTSLSAALA